MIVSEAELLPANKAAIFDALASAGIVTIVVVFDGCGDSGQIESVDAHGAAGIAPLPGVTVEIGSPSWGDGGVDHEIQSLADAIESMAYDILGETHCGWENNMGACGEFTFDVATRAISLNYNERYTALKPSAINFEEGAMGHCYHHALSSARKWGGDADNYIALHSWFDVIWSSKRFPPAAGEG